MPQNLKKYGQTQTFMSQNPMYIFRNCLEIYLGIRNFVFIKIFSYRYFQTVRIFVYHSFSTTAIYSRPWSVFFLFFSCERIIEKKKKMEKKNNIPIRKQNRKNLCRKFFYKASICKNLCRKVHFFGAPIQNIYVAFFYTRIKLWP